jgi:hypothetical protein
MLEPWLDRDYIRKALLTEGDHLVFFFSDGGKKDYCIDDCSKDQLMDILNDIQKKGIVVEIARDQE